MSAGVPTSLWSLAESRPSGWHQRRGPIRFHVPRYTALLHGLTASRLMGEGSTEVDAYIQNCPKKAQVRLREVRKAISQAAPGAIEGIRQFRIPSVAYPDRGHGVYDGVFVWYGLQTKHIGLYLRPPTIGDHKKDLAGYVTTKSAVHLPLDREVSAPLIRKLMKTSIRIMEEA